MGSAASLGLVGGSLFGPPRADATPTQAARVVVVTDGSVLDGSTIRQDIVRTMLDVGLEALTGTATPADAWRALFPDLSPDLSIGLKVNTINRYLSSHPEVTLAIAESLADTPIGMLTYPANQMLIWDRHDSELVAAGYTINATSSGVRCFGTDHSGVGYDTNSIDVHGVQKWVSRCYTDHSDRLINICLLKNHTLSGVTHSLKNHYGSVNSPQTLHDDYCNPFIPALNAALIATYGPRQTLCVCDAIYGIRSNGPMGHPQFAFNGILLSQDPVAMDAVCRQILEEHGCGTTWFSYHIDTAAGPPYNLGTSDLAGIERIDIIDPSLGEPSHPGEASPRDVRLQPTYPEPFSAHATIPVVLKRTCSVTLRVCDVAGHVVRTLHRGDLGAGLHSFSWHGTADGGLTVPAGRYVVRLTADQTTCSRTTTLLR
jgi:uncharacterized protein (DUF362 family)